MLPVIPYLRAQGFRLRATGITPEQIDWLQSKYPGFLDERIAIRSSWINARLKKRYAVPLGQQAPSLLAIGTAPPAVALSGRPLQGDLEIAIQITTPGALGTAVAQWTTDGTNWTPGLVTGPAVTLPGTGLIAAFAVGTYGPDNEYLSDMPLPAVAMGWCLALVTWDCWLRRGANPADPAIVAVKEENDRAMAEITEAANSNTGLFELPVLDTAGDSAVSHCGPLAYTEASPYVAADRQEREGIHEDARGFGSYAGV
jgi:hypothetical protein